MDCKSSRKNSIFASDKKKIMKWFNETYKKKILIGTTFLGIVFIFSGIFFYYNFFRQHNANLIETVPLNAAYILLLNDNEAFNKNFGHISPFLNEIFFFDAFRGCQSIVNKASSQHQRSQNHTIVSGHFIENQGVILYSTQMSESNFNFLLNSLQIDSRNYTEFEKERIYTYGTHFKKFYFVCHHSLFSISENLSLLKKSIQQHKQLQNLTFEEEFAKVYSITEKSKKQNWIIFNHSIFLEQISTLFASKYQSELTSFAKNSSWSAYQIAFSPTEIFLNGYFYSQDSFFNKLNQPHTLQNFSAQHLPFSTFCYATVPNDSTRFLFKLLQDSTLLSFLLLKSNDKYSTPEVLFPANYTLDSATKYKKQLIFKIATELKEEIYKDETTTYNYFSYSKGYFILADSISSLQSYLDQLHSNSYTLADAPLFRTAQINLPSEVALQFVLLLSNSKNKKAFWNPKELSSYCSQHLSTLAFTFAKRKNRIVSSQIYMKF